MSRSDEPVSALFRSSTPQFDIAHLHQSMLGLTIYEYFFGCALAGAEAGADPNEHAEFILGRAEMLAEMACARLEARRVKMERPDDQQDPPGRPAN